MPLPEDEPYTRARQFYRKWPVKGNIQVDDIDGGKAGTKGSIRPVLPSIFLFPPLSRKAKSRRITDGKEETLLLGLGAMPLCFSSAVQKVIHSAAVFLFVYRESVCVFPAERHLPLRFSGSIPSIQLGGGFRQKREKREIMMIECHET